MCIKLDFVSLDYDQNIHWAIKGQFLAAGSFSVTDVWQEKSVSPLRSDN